MDENFEDVRFDAPWYEATYPDVALSGLAAADHYRIIGRHLGRPTRPEPSKGHLADLVASVAVTAEPASQRLRVGGPTSLPIIDSPGEMRGPQAVSQARAASRPPLAGLERSSGLLQSQGSILNAFARLHGGRTADLFQLPGLSTEGSGEFTEVVGPHLRDGAFRISDLWFTSATTLCLRLELPETFSERAGLNLYQADPAGAGQLLQVGAQGLFGKGLEVLEFTLRNPLMPVLVELTDEGGMTRDVALLAFPSLARGGLHGAELVGLIDGQTTTETLWAYTAGRLADLFASSAGARLSRILVSLRQAGGGEHIFSRAVAEWLGLFGLVVEPLTGRDPDDWTRLGPARLAGMALQDDGPALILPCDGLPTIAALTEAVSPNSTAARPVAVSHLIADLTGNRPSWAVTLPQGQLHPGEFPTENGSIPMVAGSVVPVLPMAILYRDPRPVDAVRTLLPSMPSASMPSFAAATAAGGVLCVLDVSEVEAARLALTALAGQRGASGIRLALTGDSAAIAALTPEMDAILPGVVPGGLGPEPKVSELLGAAGEGEALLFLEDRVVLHDPRTLGLLRSLLAGDKVASAACVVLHESIRGQTAVVATESGGYVPSRVGLLGGPHLLFGQADTAQALPNATYPVIANALSATLVARGALEAAAERLPMNRPIDDLVFGLTAQALGWRHLCTSVVRAASLRLRTKGERVDPVALRRIAPARWDDLLSEVTLLRELR